MELAGPGALAKKWKPLTIARRDKAGVGEQQLTAMASSARGLQFTHHWGFRMGSMMSPDLLQECYVLCFFAKIDFMHAPADGNLHRVVLRLDVQPQLFQFLDNLHARVESLHSLQWTLVRSPSVSVLEDTHMELRAGVCVESAVIV